ncbi:unnamed protein product [Mytilus edulis]|uniref:YqaJ viral recombinase domain-containing protein n=1 Tax=Mytilus edulis TaxID=6550 RepID=A0A8S3RM37_MYTED|nr:unnamed protein product [Mytilus edulis]
MCYYSPCHYTSSDIHAILHHSIKQHNRSSNFSIRKQVLDEISGHAAYKSHHFPLQISQIAEQINKGIKPNINSENMKITFKRTSSVVNPEPKYKDESVQTPEEDIYALLPDVIESLKSMNRLEDFKSTLIAIVNGHLFNNIAFHLLLDVGNFFSQSTIHNTRYSEETILFWLTIQKLFKGKGINFFRGYKGQGLSSEQSIKPEECKINFAVPSDPVLCKHSAKYTLDAAKPGLLDLSLNIVSEKLKGKDVKLSIDGKKLASGFGKLGDEDLGGHETAPTLQERQVRLDAERKEFDTKKEIVKKATSDGKSRMDDFDAVDKITIKNAFLVSITNLSRRVKELRELIVKRKLMVLNLMKQVTGDWKTSKVAPAISFSQTKIIQSQAAIEELLDCIDKIGFTVACLNGTEKNYVLGNKTTIHLDQQSNYICLRNLTDVSLEENEHDATITKQRSDEWFRLREKSRLTGSTFYKGLGLGKLKDQQTHYDKVYRGKEPEISKDLQDLFDYVTEQEINALGTLLGKIMPVYFPNLTYKEDGCEVISLNDSYAIISGDGSGIDQNHSNKVAFEFKCPKPGKQRTTDVHYTLPKYYSAQVLSQMFAKKTNSFTYISFSPDSTVFIDGKMDFDLWGDLWKMAEEIYTKDAKRPTKRHEKRSETLQKVNEFVNSCHFVAEFPSLRSLPCNCPPAFSKTDVFKSHRSKESDRDISKLPLQEMSIILEKCCSALDQAYNILRKPAKEVLLTVLSDLERNATIDNTFAHALPIQYGLSGFSLTMISVRNILKDAVSACTEKELNVKVIAFDGQFLEISVEDDKGIPLTVLRFMKKFWEKVQHIDKVDKVSHLIGLNNLNAIQSHQDLTENFDIQGNNIGLKLHHKVVASGINITKALDRKTRQNERAQEDKELESTIDNEMYLLQYLLTEIITEMDEDAINMLREAGKAMTENTQLNDPLTDVQDFKPQQMNFEAALIDLIASKNPETDSTWESCSLDNFKK